MTISLSSDFLSSYYKRGDNFKTLLGRATYKSKYCRNNETWTDTIKRVVEGSIALDPNGTLDEAQKLYDIFWNMYALPAGRGIWTGGVPNMPISSFYNCWGAALTSTDIWAWTCLMLMSGGGVGLNIMDCNKLPDVSSSPAVLDIYCSSLHADYNALNISPTVLNKNKLFLTVHDSREGWADALKLLITAAYKGDSVAFDVTKVRPKGAALKTFGGLASGPGPLVDMFNAIWKIIRGASGRKLSSVECLDVTNHIGKCVASGGTRRSALIVIGNPDDNYFRTAKHNYSDVISHRFTSNNSIGFTSHEQMSEFNWLRLAEDTATYGEPGIINFKKTWETDPDVVSFNPCVEIPTSHKEACCLSEAFPALFPDGRSDEILRILTRYTLRQRMRQIEDSESDTMRLKNMRIGVGLGGICDMKPEDLTRDNLLHMYHTVRDEADRYASVLGMNLPIACTTVKPGGTVSLLNDSSPGMHAAFAPYYIRRSRIAKNEPMAASLIEAGVPHEECAYTGAWVFSFPICKKDAMFFSSDETIGTQLRRQKLLQDNWSDNSVSVTIGFEKDEVDELAKNMAKYVPQLKSVSFLPRTHGYEQAPYEAFSEEDYKEMCSKIDFSHSLGMGDLEVEDCAGGVCPIR